MKCPECEKEGKKSCVYIGGTFVTLMSVFSYYDEDGNHHTHNPNTSTTNYSCSNGHKWSDSTEGSIQSSSCPMNLTNYTNDATTCSSSSGSLTVTSTKNHNLLNN